VAAVVGDQVGFLLGRKTGHLVSGRKDSWLFKKRHLDSAHAFYEKHGGKAVVLARFVPILRTFVPFVAGMAEMHYSTFVRWNIFGGVLWVFSMILLGAYLGTTPLADQLHKVIVVVVLVSILPLVFSAGKAILKGRSS
jgi:membrane-associated protein